MTLSESCSWEWIVL